MEAAVFECARYIKEIGRGRENARALSREDACTMWAALLDDRIAPLEVGAILIAMRIKGESVDELAGFLDATTPRGMQLPMPLDGSGEQSVPVVIPSYNGARNMANLTPLLACLLAREGVPVLVHGKTSTRVKGPDQEEVRSAHAFDAPAFTASLPPRVSSAEIFETMGLPVCRKADDAAAQFARGEPVFMPITDLHAPLARVLALRRAMGVRSPAHTLVKLLQPFTGPAVRLASFTHPEYHGTLTEYFRLHVRSGAVLLMRGTEGEPVANARKPAPIECFFEGTAATVVAGEGGVVRSLPILPESRDAVATSVWIQAVLSGERPVPDAIAAQCAAIVAAREAVRKSIAAVAAATAAAAVPVQAVA